MHERVKMFLWRLDNNVLLLKSNLARRLGITDTKCPICNAAIENERHLSSTVLWHVQYGLM